MDNATLRELVQYVRESGTPRFASVYYESSHDTEDAAKVIELTWQDARSDLAEQGADEPTLAALDDAVAGLPKSVGRAGHGLVAGNGKVLVAAELATPPAAPIHRWSELPYLVPLVARGRPEIAHLIVQVDQVGAEITAVHRNGQIAERRTVEGDPQVHEPKPYGLPPRRHVREHIRERVRENLSDVANAVAELAEKLDAELIVLAGETKGRSRLRDHLPEHLRELAVDVSAARTDGRTDVELRSKVADLIAERQNEHTAAVVERFAAERARPGGHGVQGINATCEALREANVEALVIGADSEATVYVGADPVEVAGQPDDPAVSSPQPRRADEALPIAALAVGADLVYVGTELDPQDGFGALLRHR